MKLIKRLTLIFFSISWLLTGCSSGQLPPGYQATLDNLPKVATIEAHLPAQGTGNEPTGEESIQEVTPASDHLLVVTSTSEDGPGSLRALVEQAVSGDIITFDANIFPPQTPATINFTQQNPISLMQGNITIDASNAGVILSGEGIPQTGMFIKSGGNTIMGLKFVHFEQCSILIFGDDDPNTFTRGNIIGGDRSIGQGPYGQGNCFGENGTAIQIQAGGHGNLITGNLVGVDADMNNIGNIDSSIRLHDGAYENIIGPDNIIANHPNLGIMIEGDTTLRNTVTGNAIYNCGESPLLLLNGANHELKSKIKAENLSLDCNRGIFAAEIYPSSLTTIEIFSGDENGMQYFEGNLQVQPDEQENSENSRDSIFFSYDQGTAFRGSRLYITGHTAEGETAAFSEAIGCE